MDNFEGILHRGSMYNVCVCVGGWVGARACVHVKGDCRHLKCNPPMEIPGYGPDYAQYVHKHIRYMLLTAMVK